MHSTISNFLSCESGGSDCQAAKVSNFPGSSWAIGALPRIGFLEAANGLPSLPKSPQLPKFEILAILAIQFQWCPRIG
jgi:hypothetical protein